MPTSLARNQLPGLHHRGDRARPTIGFVSGGLGAYWPQFPTLLDAVMESGARVRARLADLGGHVVDAGFVDEASKAVDAGETLRAAHCDLVVFLIPTYLTSSLVVPVAQRAAAPVMLLNLQPSPTMSDDDRRDTGRWLAYCGACPVPEIANAFQRAAIPFRSISGHLDDEGAWERVGSWIRAAAAARALRTGRFGLMGHLYPGMLDVAADIGGITGRLGGHVEILEVDDLRVRIEAVTEAQVDDVKRQARDTFEFDDTVSDEDFTWAARVAAGLDALVADFDLDSLAYYHRGLGGELHERIGAGMILGSSMLTARGIPAAGEFELRTSLAMLVLSRLGAGGSFTELQALDFERGHVEMGHDGPAHLAISEGTPLLRGLGVFHGKRGFGVSVEFDVAHGPVTALGITQLRDGSLRFVVSEGTVESGPLLEIGNTTSRVNVGMDPGRWVDEWAGAFMSHHWALGTGHRAEELRHVADLLDVEYVRVGDTTSAAAGRHR